MIEASVQQLSDLIVNRRPFHEVHGYQSGDNWYWVRDVNPPFEKEILEPDHYPTEHPLGAIVIRGFRGDDLICAAILPLALRELPLEVITQQLWRQSNNSLWRDTFPNAR